MRPGYIHGSGLRHFRADTHLIDWLMVKGMITDHDLDREGPALLQPYRSHPEYRNTTAEHAGRIAGLHQRRRGLTYLGGNGFYWCIATSQLSPDVVEIPRAESGIRACASEPGEYYHALDGG